MKPETKSAILSIVVSAAVLVIFIIISIIVLNQMGIETNEQQQLTYDKCCGGNQCSDTYYNSETGDCTITSPDTNYISFNFNLVTLAITFGVAIVLLIVAWIIGNS